MMHKTRRIIATSLILLALTTDNSKAIHTTNRYYAFLERPETFMTHKKSVLSISPYLTISSTAFKRGGGNAGIPELWGFYDLHDVINSVKNVQDSSFDPIASSGAPNEFANKSMQFKVESKIKTQGVTLSYDHNLNWKGWSIGAWLPFVHMTTTSKYSFKANNFDYNYTLMNNPSTSENISEQVDLIRRTTHDKLGFTNGWENGGIGDLDLHLRWNSYLDHKMRMKGINLCVQGGAIVPTGFKQDYNNPTSLPIMGNGHWGAYLDTIAEFELKQDWILGFMFSDIQMFQKTETRRIPYYKEPAIFSALVGKVKIEPGNTFKFSPYFTLCNLSDGLNFQARYTYLRHTKDTWKDARNDPTIKSYLTQTTATVIDGKHLLQKDIDENIRVKKDWTKWRGHYMTFQVAYDTKEGLQNIRTEPCFYASWDMPINGNGWCKTHQVTLGVDLHF